MNTFGRSALSGDSVAADLDLWSVNKYMGKVRSAMPLKSGSGQNFKSNGGMR